MTGIKTVSSKQNRFQLLFFLNEFVLAHFLFRVSQTFSSSQHANTHMLKIEGKRFLRSFPKILSTLRNFLGPHSVCVLLHFSLTSFLTIFLGGGGWGSISYLLPTSHSRASIFEVWLVLGTITPTCTSYVLVRNFSSGYLNY